MTNRSVVQIDYFTTVEGESPFNCESDHLECSYVRLPNARAARLRSIGCPTLGDGSVRTVVRRGLAGSASTGPTTGNRLTKHARAAIAFIVIGSLASGCANAEAATKTTKPASKTKKTAKRTAPTRPTTTIKRVTTTVATTTPPSTTITRKLSAEAQAVLSGYEAYLVVLAAAAHEPERAEAILPKGVSGDALARLIELARFNVAEGQFWDGKRADILSAPRVQSVGVTRSTIRDCRSVGGVLRKRSTNAVVPGSTDPDVDDLIVDLVKIDDRWVVTRTDRTNAEEGKGTCTPASSP